MDYVYSEEFEVKVEMHQRSVLSPFLFTIAVDVDTELAREDVLNELLNAVDLVVMSETVDGLMNRFIEWREAFESMDLNANLGMTKVMVIGGIAKDGLSKSKVDL